jgi:hypothetical protein
MFFAQCPNLIALTFMMYDSWNSVDGRPDHPLTLLSGSIRGLASAKIPRDRWPPGYRSLKHLTVGQLADFGQPRSAFHASPKAAAPLFLLPNLVDLTLTMIREHEEDGELYYASLVDFDDGPGDMEIPRIGDSVDDGQTAPMDSINFWSGTASVDVESSPIQCDDREYYVFEWGSQVSSVKDLTFDRCHNINTRILTSPNSISTLRPEHT